MMAPVTAGRPCGSTQMMTRGTTNDCLSLVDPAGVRGEVALFGDDVALILGEVAFFDDDVAFILFARFCQVAEHQFSLLLTPLCCDDTHEVSPRVFALARCDRLVSEPLVIEKQFRWGITFATGLKRFTDPVTKLRMKHTNRKCHIPRGLHPHRIEEKFIKRNVGGEWIIEREMTMILKDGKISKFPEYHSSEEEEPTEQPRSLNKYGFVEHPQLQIGNQTNGFAPHLLPQQEGNMNGWLIEDDDELERNEADADEEEEEEEPIEEEEEEPMEEEEVKEDSEKKRSNEASETRSNSKSPSYETIDDAVESDLESTARSEPKCKEREDTRESGVRPKSNFT
ncbi:hypothetical protein Tco_0550951 [Tanacetum coccineum]